MRHRVVEVGMAVSAVMVHAGVMRAKDGPLRCFFSSIPHGPSKSVMVVETAAPLPPIVWSECSRGPASHSTRRVGDALRGGRTASPYGAWRAWSSCPPSHALSATMRTSRARMARVSMAQRRVNGETGVAEDADRAMGGVFDVWFWGAKGRTVFP